MNRKLNNSKRLSAAFVAVFFGIYLVFAPFASAYELIISGNGNGSENQTAIEITGETTFAQENNAEITNDVELKSETGGNETLFNNGEIAIVTGNVEQAAVVVNEINVSVAKVDDCCGSTTNLAVLGNGVNTKNLVSTNSTAINNVEVHQSANVQNKIEGSANTGVNSASQNLGDVIIKTGDIKTQAVIENYTNYADVQVSSGNSDLSAVIKQNGYDSNNTIYANYVKVNNINTQNVANINNFVNWLLNTGGNTANANNGKVNIKTGDIIFDLFITNKVNYSKVLLDCCGSDDPIDPDDPVDPVDPVNPIDPDDPNSEIDDPDEVVGRILPEAASTEFIPRGGPMILGLSDTSSAAARTLFFWVGIGMMVIGTKVMGEELLTASKSNNSKKS